MSNVTFKLRRGPAAEWTTDNPTLLAGEPGYESDTNQLKIGDGVQAWNDLDYLTGGGAAGADGADGVDGVDGQDGQDGQDGADGADGTNGTNGTNGADGSDGAPGPMGETYPLAGWGFVSASMNPDLATLESTLGNWVVRMWIPAGVAIAKVGIFVSTAGSAGTANNSFAVYSDAGDLLASTANDSNLWIATGWTLRSLTVPIDAEETDRFVRVAVAVNDSSPKILYVHHDGAVTTYNGGNISHRRVWVGPDRSSGWPSSFNPATEGSDAAYLPLIVLA